MSASAKAHGTCDHSNAGRRLITRSTRTSAVLPMTCMASAVQAKPGRRAAIAFGVLLAGAERVVAGREDDVLDQLVHLAPSDARAQRLDAGVLCALDDFVHLQDLG